jgi:hypothetical protein
MLDLSKFAEGETLLMGCAIKTPAGYQASNTSTQCIFSVGSFAAGGHGFSLEFTSTEVLRLAFWPVGGSALASVLLNTVAIPNDTLTGVTVELQARGGGKFNLRCHVATTQGAVSSAEWVRGDGPVFPGEDLAFGGTDAPGVPDGTGIRVGGRYGDGGVLGGRLQSGIIVQGVVLMRFVRPPPELPKPLAAMVAADLRSLPQSFPRSARTYSPDLDDAGEFALADGNADETFGVITLSDMFVAANGKRGILDHPNFSAQGNLLFKASHPAGMTGYQKAAFTALRAPDVSGALQWHAWDGVYEGLPSTNPLKPRLKLGRTTQAPASIDFPAFVMSGYSDNAFTGDTGNRGRAEIGWWASANVYIPRNEPIWVAARYFMDFDVGPAPQHVTIMQLFHQTNGAGLNPPFAVSVFADKMTMTARYCAVQNMVKADQVTGIDLQLPGRYEAIRGQWFDLVLSMRLSWNVADGGWLRGWINDEEVLTYYGPVGYRGPTASGAKRTPVEVLRVGAYPGTTTNTGGWSPDTTRDVYVRRAFACRNVGNYTLAQIRAALVA